jgi:hypothetical protein
VLKADVRQRSLQYGRMILDLYLGNDAAGSDRGLFHKHYYGIFFDEYCTAVIADNTETWEL